MIKNIIHIFIHHLQCSTAVGTDAIYSLAKACNMEVMKAFCLTHVYGHFFCTDGTDSLLPWKHVEHAQCMRRNTHDHWCWNKFGEFEHDAGYPVGVDEHASPGNNI